MRQIQLDTNLRVRFPARTGDFDDGVEVGMLAAFMTLGQPTITRKISQSALEQLRPLAQRLHYRLIAEHATEDSLIVTLQNASIRPKLRLVTPN